MNNPDIHSSPSPLKLRHIVGALCWCLGWLAIYLLDGRLDTNNLAMVLILTSSLAAVCLPWRYSVVLVVIFILVFDWFIVPPRGTFTIDFHQHTVMLLVMLVVNLIIVTSMSVLRSQSERANRHALEADTLRQLSDNILDWNTPHEHLIDLQNLLIQLSGRQVVLFVLKQDLPEKDDPEHVLLLGEASIEQHYALWYCTRNNQQLGYGTGRYEMFSDMYLPLRASGHALGAALLSNFAEHDFSTRVHLQAICDQFAHALARYRLQQQELHAREQAQVQQVRNHLLAAISHDYRTPLATIMGAASSLNKQADKMTAAQQQQLAERILSEAEQLTRITHNILQLARLDADKQLACDWQSAEEIIGNVQRRWRERNIGQRLQIELQADLPLVWCDPVLIGQLLENLIDNAFKYSSVDSVVNIFVKTNKTDMFFSVADNGPGVDEKWRDKIFEAFQRGPQDKQNISITGAGIGLALCRAIAIAHNGTLKIECPITGGSCFTLKIPLHPLPNDAQPEFFGELL